MSKFEEERLVQTALSCGERRHGVSLIAEPIRSRADDFLTSACSLAITLRFASPELPIPLHPPPFFWSLVLVISLFHR